jgi:hypothetical protein
MQFSSLEFGCVFFSFSKIFRFQQALAVTFIQKCKIVLLKIVFENLYLFWTPCVMSIEQVLYKKLGIVSIGKKRLDGAWQRKGEYIILKINSK